MASEAIGRGFESLRARQSIKANPLLLAFLFSENALFHFRSFLKERSRVVFTLKVSIFPSTFRLVVHCFSFRGGVLRALKISILVFQLLTCELF